MFKKLIFLSGFLLLANSFFAQAMQGPDGTANVGYIKADGTVQDEALKVVGKIKKDGMVTGANSVIIGYIKDDGTIQDETHKTVGHVGNEGIIKDGDQKTIGYIKIDGTVQNQNNEIIGYAKNIPVKWAAVYFFFLF